MDDQTTVNPLVQKIEQSGLPSLTGKTLMEQFNPFYEQAEKWMNQAKQLVVTDASQTTLMEDARVARLALKNIRTSVEKKRKELKEDSLRTGQTIDSVANVLKGMIEPIETHLETQERFVFIQMEKQQAETQRVRTELLRPFGVDVQFYNLKQMPESDFQTLLTATKTAHENKLLLEKQQEEQRIAEELKKKQEQEAITKENERLKKEKAKQEEQLRKQRLETQRLQKEIDDKEKEERLIAENKKKEERKLKNASEKSKLLLFAQTLEGMTVPQVKTEDAEKIRENVIALMGKLVTYIRIKSEEL